MEQIEKELGRKIMRIETNDLDEMEEVGFYVLECFFLLIVRLENETGSQVDRAS